MRLMLGAFLNVNDINLLLMIFPRMNLHCKRVLVQYREYEFISYLLRFSDRIDRMKNLYGNFFIQSQWRNDFLSRGKSISSNQKSDVKMSQFATRLLFWCILNLHSQKFVEFPQVYSLSFLQLQISYNAQTMAESSL